MSYGQFERAYCEDDAFRAKFEQVILPLLRFHPETRPVFWRMLVAQAHLYEALLTAHAARPDSNGHADAIKFVPELGCKPFDWRQTDEEATNEQVQQPLTVARAYLRKELGEPETQPFGASANV